MKEFDDSYSVAKVFLDVIGHHIENKYPILGTDQFINTFTGFLNELNKKLLNHNLRFEVDTVEHDPSNKDMIINVKWDILNNTVGGIERYFISTKVKVKTVSGFGPNEGFSHGSVQEARYIRYEMEKDNEQQNSNF